MHKLSLLRSAGAIGLAAFVGLAHANATQDSFVDVAGSVAVDGFNNLVAGRITSAQLGTGIASNVAGSAGDATLQRLTGGFYPASFGLYSFSTDSTFAVNGSSLAAGVNEIVFQSFVTVSLDQDVEGLLRSGYLPTLSYNGGSQKLAATSYSVTPVSGGFDINGNPLEADPNNPNYGYFSWSLTGISEPITSYKINFGLDVHSSALAFQVDQAVAAVPEPGSYALMLAGLVGMGFVVRRRTS